MIKRVILAAVMAASLVSAPAVAISSSTLIELAGKEVAHRASLADDNLFMGYVNGVTEGTSIAFCFPSGMTIGESVDRIAYSIHRHTENYNLKAYQMVEAALKREFPCNGI